MERVENTAAIASILVTPTAISFDPTTAPGGTSTGGTVTLENIPGTDTVRINGVPFPVNHSGHGTSVRFETAPNGEYKFEYCNTKFASITCSKPFKITIPNPKEGTVPLESLAPIVENKLALASTNTGGTVDSTEIATSGVTVTPMPCDGLGNIVGGSKLVGCVDYTKGSHLLGISTGATTLGVVSNKGYDVAFGSDGVSLTRTVAKYSYLNYSNNGILLENNFELELGVMGSDLKRTGTGIYTLIESGTGSSSHNLKVYLQN